MFDEKELGAIAAMCETEMSFLLLTEKRGIPTANHQALIASIRAKALEESARLQKAVKDVSQENQG